MQNLTSNAMVKALVETCAGPDSSLRQRHVLEQNLYALVRLAKSEQLMEIKANVKKLTGPLPALKTRPALTGNGRLLSLAQLVLPGLEEKVGGQSDGTQRRK